MSITTSMFQCLIGIQCEDFVILAADQMSTQSIIIMKSDMVKLYKMSEKLVMGFNGSVGDTLQLSQFVATNMVLYQIKNEYQLDTAALVHFTRKTLADGLKSGKPSLVNMLIAGYDDTAGAQLYSVDFLAACVKCPYAAHGYGGLFCMSVLDYYYKPSLTESEAYEILKLCVHEIHRRLFLNLTNFHVEIVSAVGVRTLPVI
ncbi:hypothetical protein ACJJTC_015543 [Scirpophaga incertulas]